MECRKGEINELGNNMQTTPFVLLSSIAAIHDKRLRHFVVTPE